LIELVKSYSLTFVVEVFLNFLTNINTKPMAANTPSTINKIAHHANDFLSD